ncbi:hypothetical protein IHE44_0010417 [Lamprotornis superbus]|uniref:C2H2-type domain-containing protein n=2 Tax=Passeriformes TaxID=9126 RepID=A0A835NIJ8_9PASS|nr:hypothetical protein IHE44_0010417 [Lamprotornis superbus]
MSWFCVWSLPLAAEGPPSSLAVASLHQSLGSKQMFGSCTDPRGNSSPGPSLSQWNELYKTCIISLHYAQMKSSDIDQELFTESYCKVCSAQLISESQRVAHYESRKHASKVRLYYMLHPIDGGCPAKKLRSENAPHSDRAGAEPPQPQQRRDSDRHCQLCTAWFNNPIMAQQHYDGKKHKKNAARADLLEQLGKTLDLGELRGLKRSYTCNICNVTLNSIEQYHAHLKGSKHQAKVEWCECLALGLCPRAPAVPRGSSCAPEIQLCPGAPDCAPGLQLCPMLGKHSYQRHLQVQECRAEPPWACCSPTDLWIMILSLQLLSVCSDPAHLAVQVWAGAKGVSQPWFWAVPGAICGLCCLHLPDGGSLPSQAMWEQLGQGWDPYPTNSHCWKTELRALPLGNRNDSICAMLPWPRAVICPSLASPSKIKEFISNQSSSWMGDRDVQKDVSPIPHTRRLQVWLQVWLQVCSVLGQGRIVPYLSRCAEQDPGTALQGWGSMGRAQFGAGTLQLSCSSLSGVARREGGIGLRKEARSVLAGILVLNKRCRKRELGLSWSFIPPAHADTKQIICQLPFFSPGCRNRWGFFFNLLSRSLLPHEAQRSSAGQVPARGQCPLWLSSFLRDQQQPESQVGMVLLRDWEGGTCQPLSSLFHGLAETKPPSFLLYANCENEKSLLKAICSKQQGLKSQIIVKGDRGYSVSGVKAMLVQNVALGLAKRGSWGGAGKGWVIPGRYCREPGSGWEGPSGHECARTESPEAGVGSVLALGQLWLCPSSSKELRAELSLGSSPARPLCHIQSSQMCSRTFLVNIRIFTERGPNPAAIIGEWSWWLCSPSCTALGLGFGLHPQEAQMLDVLLRSRDSRLGPGLRTQMSNWNRIFINISCLAIQE